MDKSPPNYFRIGLFGIIIAIGLCFYLSSNANAASFSETVARIPDDDTVLAWLLTIGGWWLALSIAIAFGFHTNVASKHRDDNQILIAEIRRIKAENETLRQKFWRNQA
jgi:hypothetical protein